jgi:hypothetical protein
MITFLDFACCVKCITYNNQKEKKIQIQKSKGNVVKKTHRGNKGGDKAHQKSC